MSTETETRELPAKTWDALREVVIAAKGSKKIAGIKSQSEWEAAAHAIAAPLIAAELRRLADEDAAEIERLRWTASCYSNGLPTSLQPIYDRHNVSMSRLRRRADELDPPA